MLRIMRFEKILFAIKSCNGESSVRLSMHVVQETHPSQGAANGHALANGHHANGAAGTASRHGKPDASAASFADGQVELQSLHATSSGTDASSGNESPTQGSPSKTLSHPQQDGFNAPAEIQPQQLQKPGSSGAQRHVANGQDHDRHASNHAATANGHAPSAGRHGKATSHQNVRPPHASQGFAESPAGDEPEVKLQPGSQRERCWRSFQQMLRKRSLIASRDLRGGFSTLLLPVLAIALVLLVLKVNINPTAPTMVLSLSALPQVSLHVLPQFPLPELYPLRHLQHGTPKSFRRRVWQQPGYKPSAPPCA